MSLPFRNVQWLLINPRINSRLIHLAFKALSIHLAPSIQLSFFSSPTNSPATMTFLHSLKITLHFPQGFYNSYSCPELWLNSFFWSIDSTLNAISSGVLPWPPKVTCYLNILTILVLNTTTYHYLGNLFPSLLSVFHQNVSFFKSKDHIHAQYIFIT